MDDAGFVAIHELLHYENSTEEIGKRNDKMHIYLVAIYSSTIFIIYLPMVHFLNCLFSGHLIQKTGSTN